MMDRFANRAVRLTAIALAAFHLYTGYAGTYLPHIQRSVPVLLSVIIVFLFYGRRAGALPGDRGVPVVDWLLVLLAIPSFGYVAWANDYLATRWPLSTTYAPHDYEVVFGVIATVLLLEATRRVMGWVLAVGAVIALAYCYFGEYIPWPLLQHRGFTAVQILDHMYLTLDGIWGLVLGVAATYIALFIIFGAFAERAGASDFIIEFVNSLAGSSRGGPAKVAVVASSMIGSVTGSSVANVYTTGQFTIPMMKRLGYRPTMAGAVEALSSNGGQIVPPVLGAAAFLIAANTGLSYARIALVSIVPALLYYIGLFWSIHLEAAKAGLVGVPRAELPSPWRVFLRGGHLLLPLVVLIGLLVYGYTPVKAAFFSVVFTVVVSWVRPDTRLGPRQILAAMEAGGKNAVLIIITCAVVGFIVGAFTLTGFALNASSAIIALSGGSFPLLLVTIGVACIFLGMGMSTVAAYVLVSVIAVPALTGESGVNDLVANMFVFYFSLLSHITPPVCLAVFAAAAVAGASPWHTAWEGIKMGFVAYLMPFLIVLAPPLLLLGTASEIASAIVTSLSGTLMLVSGVQGWLLARLGPLARALALAAGVMLLWVDPWVEVAGAAVALILLASSWRRGRAVRAEAAVVAPVEPGRSR